MVDRTRYPYAPARRPPAPAKPTFGDNGGGGDDDSTFGAPSPPPPGPTPSATLFRSFPTRSNDEPIVASMLSRQAKEDLVRWERTSGWLGDAAAYRPGLDELQDTDTINLGLMGNSKKTKLRRHYRNLQARRLSAPALPEDVPERPEVLGPTSNQKREWMLVSTEEFPELRRLEQLLRAEKSQLGNQAAMAFDRAQMTAVKPLPMTKLAVENVCAKQMKEARAAVEELSYQREGMRAERRRKTASSRPPPGLVDAGRGRRRTNLTMTQTHANGPNGSDTMAAETMAAEGNGHGHGHGMSQRQLAAANARSQAEASGVTTNFDLARDAGPVAGFAAPRKLMPPGPLAVNVGEVMRKPLAHRSARWLELRRKAEAESEAAEREELLYEESIQRHADKYVEAQERRLDYQWYFVLACRYGELSEAEFNSSSRPGAIYLKRTSKAAQGWQRMWRCFWPIRRARKYRAARFMQMLYRGYRVRKRWTPILRLRMKCGRKSAMRSAFWPWRNYYRKMKRVRELMDRTIMKGVRLTFKSWKGYLMNIKTHREEIVRKFLKRLLNQGLYKVYVAWATFAYNSARVKLMFRRSMQNPHFKTWVEMTEVWREERCLLESAVWCQRWWRGRAARAQVQQIKALMDKLNNIVKGKKARMAVWRRVREKEKLLVQQRLKKQHEDDLSEFVKIDIEWRLELAAHVKAQTKKTEERMNKWFKSKEGREAVNVQAKRIVTRGDVDNEQVAIVKAKQQRLDAARQHCREASRHDMLATKPPNLVCANPECLKSFATNKVSDA